MYYGIQPPTVHTVWVICLFLATVNNDWLGYYVILLQFLAHLRR